MKTRQMVLIFLVGISLILGVSGAVADELTRPDAEKTMDYDEDVDEYENLVGKDLTDLPDDMVGIVSIDNPEETDEYDNVVGSDLPDDIPHIVSVRDDFESDEEFEGETDQPDESEETEKLDSATLPVVIGLGLAALVIIGFISVKRR
ncbi:MAG: hypothetical protein KGY67_08200 [Candidatus Thermoplasmatota archaeon]|nr:hypothetical protein [Candidatus Thermoplasmatota archaeon]